MTITNAINLDSTGVVTGVGNGTFTGSAVTQYEVVLGAAANALTNVSGLGTSGQILTSQGTGMPPVWGNAPGGGGFNTINIQTFPTSGTYTPTANMQYCIVECIGGGGGGGGCSATSSTVSSGGGGGTGGYSRAVFIAAAVGSSATIVIGAGGTAGTSSANGGAGGTSSFTGTTASLTSLGGGGGTSETSGIQASIAITGGQGAAVGSAGGETGASLLLLGNNGYDGFGFFSSGTVSICYGGAGGNSAFGPGGQNSGGRSTDASNGNNAPTGSFGSGGGGAFSDNVATAGTGGTGSSGICVITEFLSVP